MLWISIEPCNLGGYPSYFESISIICFGQVYMGSIEAYLGCDIKIMGLSSFTHIRSEYHPGFGESSVSDKCHQLIFLILCISLSSASTFGLVKNVGFY